jgi:sulfite reductase (ferredoxin)
MQSFRSEFENARVEKDIIELEKKIRLFKEGKIDEERFRSLRLARGVYGQRQPGVQMVRIKLPYGKVTGEQLIRISDVADEYSNGKLHITTRQDIQIHYVSLDRTPQLWAALEEDDVTLREACGNTVRNIVASETAGIDVNEPFDVTPYAHAVFQFFLRNPICQEMGRKFKISFSSSDEDTALSYIHDLGFIPKIENGQRGFKVMLGGGLGSQPRHADLLYEFLPVDLLIPTTEVILRIFDRNGERARRLKARLKFLIKDLGLDGFMQLMQEEHKALSHHKVIIEPFEENGDASVQKAIAPTVTINDQRAYEHWRLTNVIRQKQKGLFAIGVKVLLGDFSTEKARQLAALIQQWGANELRFTTRQNILIRNIREDLLPFFYQELQKLGFAIPGYNATIDITACPGTDTCNLGIASSTGIAEELEKVLVTEYPDYINNKSIVIKISGCMNACGQHNMAHIGFQGMSIRTQDKRVAPALQILLGGGALGNGQGRFADKVIKIPSKRGPQAIRLLLNDFETNGNGQSFLDYYDAQGEKYFYDLLLPLSNVDNLLPEDFIDWGNGTHYVQAIGVGECAGVVIDLVQTLFLEAEEKSTFAYDAIKEKRWSDAIYHTYASFVNGAKALLTAEDINTNTQAGIIKQFDELFVETKKINLSRPFTEVVLQINKNEPTEAFAKNYMEQAVAFLHTIENYRKNQLGNV